MRKYRLRLLLLGLASLLAWSGCGLDDQWMSEDLNQCPASCRDRECGLNWGCDCGSCGSQEICFEGQCHSCPSLCSGRECGWAEGCDCGDCGDAETCRENVCVPCEEICASVACGSRAGCQCGSCPEGFECNAHEQCECVPSCTDSDGNALECGDDGCGGSCGTCPYGQCVGGSCACAPQCSAGSCDDGCGGDCGGCDAPTPVCFQGSCYPQCSADAPSVPFAIQKIVAMQVGTGGYPGEALDVDENPDTCSPAGDCEQGIDNSLSAFASQVEQFVDADAEMEDLLKHHGLVLAIRLPDGHYEGDAGFDIRFYQASPVLPRSECDYQEEDCDYEAWTFSLNPTTCQPFWMGDITIDGSVLLAGGPDHQVLLPNQAVPHDNVRLMNAYHGQLKAEVVFCQGGSVCLTKGVLAGAFRKADLLAALDAVPDDAEWGFSRDMFKNLVDMFVVPDIDTDGDGVPDAASLAYKFTTIPGTIVGFQED